LPNKNDLMLTPNYDVLNTRYHINNETSDIAMELFDKHTKEFDAIGFLSHQDFKRFALLSGIGESQFMSIVQQASKVDEIDNLVEKSYLSQEGKKFYIENYKDRLHKRLLYNPKIY
jgi:serine/threonine-protein kinase HipA